MEMMKNIEGCHILWLADISYVDCLIVRASVCCNQNMLESQSSHENEDNPVVPC